MSNTRTSFVSTNVIAHPTLRKNDLLKTLGPNPTPGSFLDALTTFVREDVDLAPLAELAPSIAWEAEPAGIDRLANYLGNYVIEFSERDAADTSISDAPETKETSERTQEIQEAANQIYTAIKTHKEKIERLAFTRAWFLAPLLKDALGDDSPVEVIERHMRDVFRPSSPIVVDGPAIVDEASAHAAVLRGMAAGLMIWRPTSKRVGVINYFLSSPYENNSAFSIKWLRSALTLRGEYRKLLFLRYTASIYEGLRPMPEQWEDLKWLFKHATSAWELRRVVEASYELIDHASDYFHDQDNDVENTLNAFFACVRHEQDRLGGMSFWDEEFAAYKVHDFFRGLADLANVRTDLHSHLCWLGQADHAQAEPGFSEWEELIGRALEEGYVHLAQALTAYKLIEDILFLKRVSDWPSFTSLVRLLRAERHHEVLQTSIRLAAELFRLQQKPLLAARIDSFALPARPREPSAAFHLIEGTAKVGRNEVEVRLIEHVGPANWSKLAPESKRWLIEADINWSEFNYRSSLEHDRTDWSFPASLFVKALEYELTLRYQKACRDAGDWIGDERQKNVGIGQVIKFHKEVLKGDPLRASALAQSGGSPLPQEVVRYLERLKQKYRNTAAHSRPFDRELLSALRWELFGEGKLRVILNSLPASVAEN